MLGDDQLVQLERTLLVVSLVSQNRGETFFDELLGNVATRKLGIRRERRVCALVVRPVRNGDTFPFIILAILGLNVIDVYMDRLADESLSQEPES